MGRRNYRIYTQDFKLQALDLLKSSGKSAGQIERDLGITPGLLFKWQAKYQAVERRGAGGEIDLELTDLEAAKRELNRLKRELAEVEEERDILKKQSAFSPAEAHEVRLYGSARKRVWGAGDVSGLRCRKERLLRLAEAAAECQRAGGAGVGEEYRPGLPSQPPDLWQSPDPGGP
jgi:transposase